MGLPKFKTKISVEDYLEGEKISPVKHENHDVVELASVEMSIPLPDLYRHVQFQKNATRED